MISPSLFLYQEKGERILNNKLLDFLKIVDQYQPDFPDLQAEFSCDAKNNLHLLGYKTQEMYYMTHSAENHNREERDSLSPSLFFQGRSKFSICNKCLKILEPPNTIIDNIGKYGFLDSSSEISTNNFNYFLSDANQQHTPLVDIEKTLDNENELLTDLRKENNNNFVFTFGDNNPTIAEYLGIDGVFNKDTNNEPLKQKIIAISIGKETQFSENMIYNFQNLRCIVFRGTKQEWDNIEKPDGWFFVNDTIQNEMAEVQLNEKLLIPERAYVVICIENNWKTYEEKKNPEFIFEKFIENNEDFIYATQHLKNEKNQHFISINFNDISLSHEQIVCCYFTDTYRKGDEIHLSIGKTEYKLDCETFTAQQLNDYVFKKNTLKLFILDYINKKAYFFPEEVTLF